MICFISTIFLSLTLLDSCLGSDPRCREFSVDQCSAPKDSVGFEHSQNVTQCQNLCKEAYAENCTFFIQNLGQKICEIWTTRNEEYEETCIKHAGPDTPWRKDPLCQTDLCSGFEEGFCKYGGNILQNLDFVDTEMACQVACQHVPGCKYYVWDKSMSSCQLLDSTSRQCEMIKGLAESVDYQECHGPSTIVPPLTTSKQ